MRVITKIVGGTLDPGVENGCVHDRSTVRFGDDVLCVLPREEAAGARRQETLGAGEPVDQSRVVDAENLYLVVQTGRTFQHFNPDVAVVLDRGRHLVVQLEEARAERLRLEGQCGYTVEPLPIGSTVVEPRKPQRGGSPVPWITALLGSLDRSRLEANVRHLAGYPTRRSTSAHYSAAAEWARGQLRLLGYRTEIVPITVEGRPSCNVVADRPGRGSGRRSLVIVTAHLDSINASGGPGAPAPGADDNASGAAGLLELAHALRAHPGTHDLRLVLFGGEEQGLQGSRQFVSSLSSDDRARVSMVLNLDMIGSRNTPTPTVLLEGAPVSAHVLETLRDGAATYTALRVETSLRPYNSDHVSFIDAGLPAALTIEGSDRSNPVVHTAADTVDRLDYGLAMEILRMNLATVARAIERNGGTMSIFTPPTTLGIGVDFSPLPQPGRPEFSGRYVYNGGVSSGRTGLPLDGERRAHDGEHPRDPIYAWRGPAFLPEETFVDGGVITAVTRLRFTLHVDIDGDHPLNVVSGAVAEGWLTSAPRAHFIGRVTSNTPVSGGRSLVVEDLRFSWPRAGTVDRIEITLTWGWRPRADVTFVESASGRRHGPYSVVRQSWAFREVEVDVDVEDGAVQVEPYDTHTHPDRPADLHREELTLELAYERAGIVISRSEGSGSVVNTSEAGSDRRWTNQELHDSMQLHWDAFANLDQWKMWIFLAQLGSSDDLGGIMFDGRIDEPGGVDRQGTAVFTRAPHYHTLGGAYVRDNAPGMEAIQRELFFNLIHESGHAFNLAHSDQKQASTPWSAPSWMPVRDDPLALSWMNYPELPMRASLTSHNATWFYSRFRFRFSDEEHLFMRHAPERFVVMGGAEWGLNHGRVARSTLDRRLRLDIRTRQPILELGQPVLLEAKLANVSDEPVLALPNLDPSDGFLEIAVTGPDGTRVPFLPVAHFRRVADPELLEPGGARYTAVNLTVGLGGFPFKRPGPYRVEASYTNIDRRTAATVLQLYVRPPENWDDARVLSGLWDARVGRVLTVGGTRVMHDVNDKLDWLTGRLGGDHPASYFLTAAQALPLAKRYKLVPPTGERLRVLDAEPDEVVRKLDPVIEHMEPAADAIGHITYRRVVDTYTDCALEVRERGKARDAQSSLLGLFRERSVVPGVVADVERRVDELR